VFHVPVTILFIGSNSGDPSQFIDTFNIYERIQLIGFTIQESTISAVYIWQAHVNLQPILNVKGADGKYLIRHLIALFIAVLVLDISLILSEYTNNFEIQTTYKPVVYSVKLKVEFIVLNELLAVTKMTTYPWHSQVNTMENFNGPQLHASGAIPSNNGGGLIRNGEGEETGTASMRRRQLAPDHISDGHLTPACDPTRELRP
jgi:hypothetical protein